MDKSFSYMFDFKIIAMLKKDQFLLNQLSYHFIMIIKYQFFSYILSIHQYMINFYMMCYSSFCLLQSEIVSDPMSSVSSNSHIQSPSKQGSQFKALFLKNGQLQAKQPCTNICQIMTTVICLIFTYLIKELASQNLPKASLFQDITYPEVFGDYTLIDNISKQIKNGKQTGNPSRLNALQWYLFDCQEPSCNNTLLGRYDGSKPSSDEDTILGAIPNASPRSQCNYQQNYYDFPDKIVNKYIPFFDNTTTINGDLYDKIQKIQKNSFVFIKTGNQGLDLLPDGAIDFKILNQQNLKATLHINDVRDLDMHRNNGVTGLIESRIIEGGNWTKGQRQVISAYGLLNMQHLISASYLKHLTRSKANGGDTLQSGYIFMRDTESSKSFVDSIINTVSALIFPLSLSLLFPVMLYGLVLQKQQKLVQMMKMNGMKISNYWLVYFIFNFILCLVTNVVFFLIGGFVLKTTFFLKTSPLLLILVAVGWSLAQIGLAAFFQTFLSKARSANIIGYVVAIWTMMIGATLNIGVYQVPSQFPGWLQAIPPFAFNRLFYLMLMNCSDADCYNTIGEINGEMKNCLASLYVGFVVLFALGAYFLEVLPQEFGVKRHPLFPFKDFYKFVTCKKDTTYTRPERDREQKKYIADGEEDPLSKNQRETITKILDVDPSIPLVINNLRKLYKKQGYKGDFAACKSFNLKVEDKETFGLLGPNGAGKTTLISMLTGMITPDYGNAWIGGYDIQNNVSLAQLEMGVCPQFDLLWPQLTVQEHLRFYARLKGIPGSELQAKVNQAIEEVKLIKFRKFLSSALSGGMKRRLSIAISLVGDPKIVFLDEPSSGLDPDNRRQIWQVLARCQDKRAVFLTTHMMEEADALCHRIGIITHGTLRTVGNQLRLKKQYGQGYRLSLSLVSKEKKLVTAKALNLSQQNVNMQPDAENDQYLRRSISLMVQNQAVSEHLRVQKGVRKIANYINKCFPGSILNRVLGSSLIFKVPNTYKISDMFMTMHQAEKKLQITNVAITDSSLEDVFIAVVKKYDKINDDNDLDNSQLVSIPPVNEIDEVMLREDVPIPESVLPMATKSPEQQKYGSVIQKSRESVMSEHEMKSEDSDD